jgi:serine/threonine protein kinase
VRVPRVRDFHTTPRLRVAGVRPVTDTTVTVSDMVLSSEQKPSQTLGTVIARTLFRAQNDRRRAQEIREQGGDEASALQYDDDATRKVDSVLYALYMAGYALRHLWRQGVVHGDFHVNNILLTSNPTTGTTIHVIDFGRAVRKRDLAALVGKRSLREYDILQPDDPAVHQRTYKRADDLTVLSASGPKIGEEYVNDMWQLLCGFEVVLLLESIQRTTLNGLDYEVLGPLPFRMIRAVVDGLTRNDEAIPPELRHPPLEPDIQHLFRTNDDLVLIDTTNGDTVVRRDNEEYEPSEHLQELCNLLQRITKGMRTTILHYGGLLDEEHTASASASASASATIANRRATRTKRVTLSGGRAR